MVRFVVNRVPLDGTNDVPFLLTVAAVSVTVVADTTSITVSVRPSPQSDFLPLNSGDAFTFAEAGRLIEPTRMTLRAATAVSAYVVVAYP